jgi:hypothetical protein
VIVAGPLYDRFEGVDGRERSDVMIAAFQEFTDTDGRVLLALLPGPEFRVEDSEEYGREFLPRWDSMWRCYAHGRTLSLLRSIGVHVRFATKACRETVSHETKAATAWARRHVGASDVALSVTCAAPASLTPLSAYASGDPVACRIDRGSTIVVLPFRTNDITADDVAVLGALARETLAGPRAIQFRVRFDRKNRFDGNVLYPALTSGRLADPGHLEPKLCAYVFAVALEAWRSGHPRVSRRAVTRILRDLRMMRAKEKPTTIRREANRGFVKIFERLGRRPYEVICADGDLIWFRFPHQIELVVPSEFDTYPESSAPTPSVSVLP